MGFFLSFWDVVFTPNCGSAREVHFNVLSAIPSFPSPEIGQVQPGLVISWLSPSQEACSPIGPCSQVLNHAFDEQLGGRDFDRVLSRFLFAPSL